MIKTFVRAIGLAAAVVPLGACSSFLGIHFGHHEKAAGPALAVRPVAPAQPAALETGRRQLADGQTGLAIESFQRALADGEHVAAALNGLGVAYARLGRFDLAQRFFQEAMAADPADARYADNLARLMRSPALALRRDADVAATALQSAPAPAAQPKVELGRLQRVSRGEVHITAAPIQAAPTAYARTDQGFHPLVRLSLSNKEPQSPEGSIRVVLPESAKAPGQHTATANFNR
jgi:hypothetical protein